MGKISESRRCRKCGNKSYTQYEGGFQIYTYSCRCGNVFSNFVIGNLKLAQMMADSPKTFFNLTILDLVRLLEEDAFKKDDYFGSFLYTQEIARFKEQLSNLPTACKLILNLCEEMEKEMGIVDREKLIEVFSKEHHLKSQLVENYIDKLLDIGGLFIPRNGFLHSVYSFDDKMGPD